MSAILIALASALSAPAAGQAPPKAVVAASPVPSPDARRLVTALHVRTQMDFMIPRLSPLFAQQMLVQVQTSERFKPQLATTERRDQLQAAFRAAFEQTFQSHIAEMVDGVALEYDRRLSPADLHSVANFMSSGAGARYAAITADVQQSSSGAGARLGALAGEEAYDVVLKRLDSATRLLK